MRFKLFAFALAVSLASAAPATKECKSRRAGGPFLKTISANQHIIGNDYWNITIGKQYGTKLYYKNHDLVGDAVGHYASYNGRLDDLNWTSVSITKQTIDYLDVAFTSAEGDFHWVIYANLSGSYQYFVNRALPVLGEFRTLFRLDNKTFVNGKTNIKDGPLPTLAQIDGATNVQDETWQLANGSYITKYDWTDFIRTAHYYGVYGPSFGSWYINPGKDDYNGNHLKQELMVHRESLTGDVVQLNMIHGTHFMASSADAFPVGKVWGPWLWYLNNGSAADAALRATGEEALYPYSWFDNTAYQSRGSVSGSLTLSDGRHAAGAAVFLGDNNPNETSLDMGRYYYYTTYADANGAFQFANVRSATYGLQAWSNGGSIGNVSTTLLVNNVAVAKGESTSLGNIAWKTQGRTPIFQVGDLDRTSLGFKYGGAPHEHALVTKCPANLDYTIGTSVVSNWCFAQSAIGSWTIHFNIPTLPTKSAAVLSVSLAGYSSGVDASIILNGAKTVGSLSGIPSDPCLYRSGTTAGEWHYFEYAIAAGALVKGANTIAFKVTRTSLWHGFMWDSIILEWA